MMKKCVQYLQLNNYLNLEKFIFQQTKYIQSIHLEVDIPKGKLTVVTGVSGSGKTTMNSRKLVTSRFKLKSMTHHYLIILKDVQMEGIEHIKLIDASPIGINIRSNCCYLY